MHTKPHSFRVQYSFTKHRACWLNTSASYPVGTVW